MVDLFDRIVRENDCNSYNFKHDKKDYINLNEEDQMEIQGYVYSKEKANIVRTCYLLSFGLLRLLFHWYPELHLKATHSSCSLKVAEKVLIIDIYKNKYKSYFVKEVKVLNVDLGRSSGNTDNIRTVFNLCDGRKKELYNARIIRCKKLTYVWDDKTKTFCKLAGFDKGITRADIHTFGGQNKEEQNLKRIVYGDNEISVPIQSILTLLVLEALTPFYIFQMCSLIVWLVEDYIYYSIAIMIMSAVGIATSVVQTRKNQINLKGTVHSQENVTVCRGNDVYEEIPSTDLVPGDVIVIPPTGCQVQCDAVLVSGSCVVNESMLTGESVPVTKTPLPNNEADFNLKEDTNHTLFCGTKVIQTRSTDKVLAVVIRTGYLTAKGELVRSILYPPPADFKFERDSYKFIGILSIVGIMGVIYTIVSKSSRNIRALDIIIKALDVVTIAVPPALPAAMTVGKLYALNRLKKSKIFCINSRVINVTGSIDCVCFDKMFESTKWNIRNEEVKRSTIVESTIGEEDTQLQILKQFQFSSNLQRMSVIVKSSNSSSPVIFCKGSPEMISSLSNEFSVPTDFFDMLGTYTSQGYRVLALAKKNLEAGVEIDKLNRENVEYDLELLGLIILENRLKPETTPIMKLLKEANLKVVMITGDNIKTGIHIARECGMVDPDEAIIEVVVDSSTERKCHSVRYIECYQSRGPDVMNNNEVISDLDIEKGRPNRKYCYAISGKCWAYIQEHFPELVQKIVVKGKVFARMSGMQKQQLIEELKDLGYYVAMSGDGANDCGALKAAHVGVSLSEAESSVASPFTSQEQNISCIPKVIKEGRAALVTSFGIFKVMLCYSLTQFASVLILYNIDSNLSSLQFLFIDTCLILNFATFFGVTKAYEVLDKVPPRTSLMGFIPICSMIFFMVIATSCQIFGYYHIQTYEEFIPFKYNEKNPQNFVSVENYVVFTVSTFQYITMVVAFSKGRPYRQPLYTNTYLTFSLVITTLVSIYITIDPAYWIKQVLELKLPPIEARYAVLVISSVCFVASILTEDVLVEYLLAKFVAPRFKRSKKKYEQILKDEDAELCEKVKDSHMERINEKCGIVNSGFVGQ
ncbi:unnamed protein product [Acanthoscelides obtectus]|uniref:Cation-transporting ATPase n=1 Tax=Acanthoscelides obtectus TaxID=200917 RepID=A0A9P0LJG0_ACAOB|nr:unnamed protein product [Acanthoscelides obtectus]CAK1660806.1 Cation-transporting ATPase 13A2 [Acanthoscelides obtectus]